MKTPQPDQCERGHQKVKISKQHLTKNDGSYSDSEDDDG